MFKRAIVLYLSYFLVSCSITPEPLSVDDRYHQAQTDLQKLFAQQSELGGKLDFYQALARGMTYNLDYRIKLVNSALQAGQLKIAEWTMYPAFNATGTLYKRNNQYASFGVTETGSPTGVLTSTPNTIRSARVGLTWNILDFGLGYVKAKQQSDRLFIADEEARKQLQQLAQDVLVAYWSAYSAQQLMGETKEFQVLLTQAKNQLIAASKDKTVPKENLLTFEASLLEGSRKLVQLQYKYDKAMIDLKHLLNLPPDKKLILKAPPLAFSRAQDLENIDFKKLDAIALVNRSELRGQHYQEKIAELGVKTAVLQSFPGITLAPPTWNYNSNKYLLNTLWVDQTMDVAWNLLNLASLPTTLNTAKTQIQYEKLKLMALTMTVLAETRYAYSHYQTIRNEYMIAHQQTLNANALYELNKDRQLAYLESSQQVLLAKLHTITAKMDENLLLSDLSTALGELYLSIGTDSLPNDLGRRPVDEITRIIAHNFEERHSNNFILYINKNYQKIFTKPIPVNQKPYPVIQQPVLAKVQPAVLMTPQKEAVTTQWTVAKPEKKSLIQSTTAEATTYTIQLAGSYDLDEIENLEEVNGIEDVSSIGIAKIHGRDWYILTCGKYTTVDTARSSMQKISNQLALIHPAIISTDAINWIS